MPMKMMKSAPMFGRVAQGKAAKGAKTSKPAMAAKPTKALPMRGGRTATNKMKKGM